MHRGKNIDLYARKINVLKLAPHDIEETTSGNLDLWERYVTKTDKDNYCLEKKTSIYTLKNEPIETSASRYREKQPWETWTCGRITL